MAANSDAKNNLVARIEADLLAGHFRPGEWLKQADIENQYNANRFDIRMALMDLKARQLIDHVPNKGFRVTQLTVEEREELMQTRMILETAAARLAAARITDDQIEALEGIAEEFERNIPVADVEHLREINARFHNVIYQASGNDILVDEIKALRFRGIPGMRGERLAWRTIAGIRKSHEDHIEMLELLRARDGEALSHVVEGHLSNWRNHVPGAQAETAAD